MTEAASPSNAAGVIADHKNITNRILAILISYVLLVTILFLDTAQSMAAIWMSSDTYAHGFLIPPICIYLAWRLRGRFSALAVRPEPRVLVLVIGAGIGWLIANMVDVQVVQQFSYAVMLVAGIWAIVGTAVVRSFSFPLGFLFLAVPMGSGLIPPLMEFTADSTEYLLRLSGIPVLREGMFLFLPTGTWSIVEECSGVRYVIASFTLGLCYAHLNYTDLKRQALFVLVALITPVLMNGLRAYLVVLVGHLSEMRFGTGDDHLWFGWILFGIAMLMMFWLGSFWQQPQAPFTPPVVSNTANAPTGSVLSKVFVLALLSACCWPIFSTMIDQRNNAFEGIAFVPPQAQSPWHLAGNEPWPWIPYQPGAGRELDQGYTIQPGTETAAVSLHLRQYLKQERSAELINTSINPFSPDPDVWQIRNQRTIQANQVLPWSIVEAQVVSGQTDLLVWSWYRIDSQFSANQYLVKLLEAKQQILQGHRRGSRIFIATRLNNDRTQARQILGDFVSKHLVAIESSLDSGISLNGLNSPSSDLVGEK